MAAFFLALGAWACGDRSHDDPSSHDNAGVRPATRALIDDLVAWDRLEDVDRTAACEQIEMMNSEFQFARLETFSCGGASRVVGIFTHTETSTEFSLIVPRCMEPENEGGRALSASSPILLASRREISGDELSRVIGIRGGGAGAESASDVTFATAERYCKLVGVRLPTDDEWTLLCLDGAKTDFCFGDDPRLLTEFAWFEDNSKDRVHRPGEKRANRFGLFDVHGNVWEWCSDRVSLDDVRVAHMLRGGSYGSSVDGLRTDKARTFFADDIQPPAAGIRPVFSPRVR